ncbi:MAG: hypothetical protein WDN28_22655 [Chthoniobacter sp.]
MRETSGARDGQRLLSRLGDSEAIRERESRGHAHRPFRGQSGGETRGIRRLDADDFQVRLERLEDRRHAREQPTAPDRNEDRLGIRHLLEDLESQRPCPAITCGSSKGCTYVSARSSASRPASRRASSKVSPCSTTVAPNCRQRATFTSGAKRGITTVTGTPSKRPCHASPSA